MHIRVVAPSRSMKIIAGDCRELATKRLQEMGHTVSYGKNVEAMSDFVSASVEEKLADLHEAFADKSVEMIMTAIGGFNSVQLLNKIDYDLIAKNPKPLCGFSDITALTCAIHAKTGIKTYSGVHYSSLGMLKGAEYSIEYFKKCLFGKEPFEVKAAGEWSDDAWFLDQENREFIKNSGHWVLNNSSAKGKIVGGNLCTFNLLQGTSYMPSLKDCVLFIEDDADTKDVIFDRMLHSLSMQKDFDTVRGILIGRFQKPSNISRETLEKIVATKEHLKKIPVIGNVDFGHTTPIITFPIGGVCEIKDGKIWIEG